MPMSFRQQKKTPAPLVGGAGAEGRSAGDALVGEESVAPPPTRGSGPDGSAPDHMRKESDAEKVRPFL